MPNFSSLLFTTVEENCFLNNLNIDSDDLSRIDDARKDIRKVLKENLPNKLRDKGLEGEICEPRFYIQGSRSYKTLNSPCTTPPQQSDIDDGVYLPLSVMREEKSPRLAIELFFDSVMEVLNPLCGEKGWALEAKDTCVRVIISAYAHIDLPLYVIPDDLFQQLKVAMESYGYMTLDEAMSSQRDSWTMLPSDRIMFADRKQGWRNSDPMKMKAWFKDEVQERGEQLIRIVRYLKAFRDKQWKDKGPSSILLMAVACPLFEKDDRRDDRALLNVVKGIPSALKAGVLSPIDSEASLTDHMSKEAIDEAAAKFETFAQHLEGAIHATDSSIACSWMREMLGDRFPDEPQRMKSSQEDMPPAMAAIAPLAGPAEAVKRTRAG